MDQIIKYALGELRVIGDAPAIFAAAILMTGAVIWGVMKWRYSRIITNKESAIWNKEAVIALYKERLDGASPDQAKSRMDSLEGQIMSLKDREWPKLTPSVVMDLENSLKAIGRPQEISVLPQDRDSAFLARDLVDVFRRIGWPAKCEVAMNGVPDGLSVWPDSDVGSAVRDALAKAASAPVALRDDKHSREQSRVAVGIGYRMGLETAEVAAQQREIQATVPSEINQV